jgi:agmatinase
MIFGNLESEYSSYQDSPVVIIPVPFDETSTWVKGAAKGPEALFEASANMWFYDRPTKKEVYLKGIHTTHPTRENSDPDKMVNEVEHLVRKHLENKKLTVVAGGNHSVSIGAIRAAASVHENLTVVQLDAHADLMDEFDGSIYNHACAMARAREVAKIIQIGIRSIGIDELTEIDAARIFYADDIIGKSDWYAKVTDQIDGPVYLTIDLDVFDPSIMPATGTPVPGGLNYREVYDFISYLSERKKIIGFDVVELCPIPYLHAPNYLAAQLMYQIISLLID